MTFAPPPRIVDLPAHVSRLAEHVNAARVLCAAHVATPFLDAVIITPRDWRARIGELVGMDATGVASALVTLQERGTLRMAGRRVCLEAIPRPSGWPTPLIERTSALGLTAALARSVLPRRDSGEMRIVAALYAAAGTDCTVADVARLLAMPAADVRAVLTYEVSVMRLVTTPDLLRWDLRAASRRVAERAEIDG